MDEANAPVFVSYAHADDEPFEPDADGWVTRFVANLEKSVRMQRGGKRVSLWMDHRLEPQRHVDELRRRIAESRVFLAFLSPGYLESPWCVQELDTFVSLVGLGSGADRVFLIEVRPTERSDWHAGVRDLIAIPFWHQRFSAPVAMPLGFPLPNPRGDAQYWEQINFLADALVRQIDRLPPAVPIVAAAPPSMSSITSAATQPATDGELRIVINADAADAELGRKAQAVFDDLDVYATLAPAPLPTQPPAEYRRALETQLRDSHGVLIVYGSAPPTWVQAQHGFARRVLATERKGCWSALLDGPPADKPDHGLPARNLMMLDCRNGLHPEPLRAFVQTLRGGSAHV